MKRKDTDLQTKRHVISVKALLISIVVIIAMVLLPEVYDTMSGGETYDPLIYTAKALNLETGEEVYIGNYKDLIPSYIDSFEEGLPDKINLEFWEEGETYAPFKSTSVQDFISGDRVDLIQGKLLSLIIQREELGNILSEKLKEPKDFKELQEQLTQLEGKIMQGVGDKWKIPDNLILNTPKDSEYHAKVSNKMVGRDDLGIEIIFIHPLGGVPEIAEWAFNPETVIGKSASIQSYIGEHEVVLDGFVSGKTVEKYMESSIKMETELDRQYRERLSKWKLVSS
jgi:hypothetical protein